MAIKKGKFLRALITCRADITQYTIWHKSHTEPLVLRGVREIQPMLEIDIRALAELVSELCWLSMKIDRPSDLPATLERLRGNIVDPRWQRKISYFHSLNALGIQGDRDTARKEFKKLGTVTFDEDDVEILQLFIDLHGEEIPFSDRIKYFDRILSLSDKVSDRLQYQGAKASEYMLIGDKMKAEHELVEAIEYCRENESIQEMEIYGRIQLSKCLELLAFIRRDQNLFHEAISHITDILDKDGWTAEGRADQYRAIADCYRYAGNWKEANNAYNKAIQLGDSSICEVFLSEILLRQDKLKESVELISNVERQNLNQHEFEDFVFTFSAIAIEEGDLNRLSEAKTLLEKLEVSAPYFNTRRLKLLVNVQATMASGPSVSIVQKTRLTLARMARSKAKYFVLQPNFMGLGINLNSIIDDMARNAHEKAELGDDE